MSLTQSLLDIAEERMTQNYNPAKFILDKGDGARVWDIDGNEYVDYYGGHGALILGHGHPQVLEAVHTQLELGTHFGACHELEVRWGQLVKDLVPCAERVRFTSSGTEANLMGLRLARAFTGKPKVVRFLGHFHGWHDHVAFASTSHFDGTLPAGITPATASTISLCPPNDIERVEQILDEDEDIAAVILEPTGAAFGHIPTPPEFVRQLRKMTASRGTLLIFDEVISGFRLARGGAQEYLGVTPDLATLAKVLAGGLPGGAVVGGVLVGPAGGRVVGGKMQRDRGALRRGPLRVRGEVLLARRDVLQVVPENRGVRSDGGARVRASERRRAGSIALLFARMPFLP